MNSHTGLLSSLPASRPSFAFSPMRIDPVSNEQRDQDQLHHQVWLITNSFRPLYMYLLVEHRYQIDKWNNVGKLSQLEKSYLPGSLPSLTY